ncbi:protein Mdm4 isoform X1 [Arapaima gigas]
MTTLSTTSQYSGANSASKLLPGDGTQQVQPKAPLLQLLRLAGAQEETFTLKEVMHYLGQYIMGKQLYDKQRQHIVHCQDDPLGELLEVESFSVKNPSPVYEMLKKNLIILNGTDAAKTLSVGKDCNETASEDPGQRMFRLPHCWPAARALKQQNVKPQHWCHQVIRASRAKLSLPPSLPPLVHTPSRDTFVLHVAAGEQTQPLATGVDAVWFNVKPCHSDPAAVPADVSCGEEARLPSASRDCEEDPLTLQTVSTPLAHLTVANEGS